jgi:hypothetical protein
METSLGFPNALPRILLMCGIAAAVLYALADLLGIFLKPGYNFISETAGLLTAPASPSRPYVLAINVVADLILLAFVIGLWMTGGGNWAQRVMAVFIAVNALTALVALVFFPMHPDEAVTSQANRLNVIFMAASMFCFVLAIIFGIPANHNWLRWVSLGIILFFIIATVIGLIIPRLHGPTIGIQERTMMYFYLAWLVMQSLVLLKGT